MNEVCCWEIKDKDHKGNVEKRSMFSGQIEVPACEKHYREHLVVIALASIGENVEDILNKTYEEQIAVLTSKVPDVDAKLLEIANQGG